MAQTFITGGSGFIGRRLVHRLVTGGHAVKVLVRSAASADVVAALGAEPVHGELTDPATWSAAAEGSEVLFHLAAETDITASRERQELITVGGTRAALQASRQAGVARFVHCGSESALLAGEPLIDVDESAPLRPDSEAAYCATKAQAEALVLAANAPGFTTVSIRPRFVWGPESSLIEGLLHAARNGQFAWIEGGRHTTDVTFVDNAVEGLVRGWTHGRSGQAYFITDQHRVTLREFLETNFAIYGLDATIPDIDAATAAGAIPVPARWFLEQVCTLRTGKAVAELGYRPVVTQAEGLNAVRESLTRAAA
ncbi:NAD-dependent epimerase/dehydratase family protein [Actinoplanes sp. NPDC020271]|uniref:NAD-dependent epimerase/dehydratase family protein n=1 Tax=Actinoplanes sp. NPDC020271 TaxID=3363896 RepID=UPI00379345EF